MTNKCPRCFRTLTHDLFAWECEGTCEPLPDSDASAHAGTQMYSRPLLKGERPRGDRRWLPPTSVKCPKCKGPARDVCPHCHYELLPQWREVQTVCIALAGARATGKTIYLAVLIKELEEMFTHNHLSLAFADLKSRTIYEENYEKPLYEARGIPRATNPAADQDAYQRDPIILNMGVLRSGPAMLVFRDVAGEDLENPPPDIRYLNYFERSDIVLFLFDPSAVRDVRDLLKDYLPQETHQGGDPERVLEVLLSIMGASPIPFGMVVSKFDTMQALALVEDQQWSQIMSNAGAAFSRDPGINEWAYDRMDGDLLHEEARSLLNKLHAQRFVNTLTSTNQWSMREYRFFAVSALGDHVIGEKIHPRGIAPFRCLDPIRWVLARRGVA